MLLIHYVVEIAYQYQSKGCYITVLPLSLTLSETHAIRFQFGQVKYNTTYPFGGNSEFGMFGVCTGCTVNQ